MKSVAELVLVFAFCVYSVHASVCTRYNVRPCPDPIARDLLFVLDASASMDRTHFYETMLDYVQHVYCSFDRFSTNQVGLLLFAREIKVVIPLAPYSVQTWYEKGEMIADFHCSATNIWELAVEEVRATRNLPSTQQACCSVSGTHSL